MNQKDNNNVFTFITPNGSKSCIDQFLISSSSLDRIINNECVDFTATSSEHGHLPILIDMDYNCLKQKTVKLSKFPDKIAWHKIDSFDDYRSMIDTLTESLSLTLDCFDCCDLKCKDPVHIQQIDKFCSQLTDMCILAAEKTLPKVKKKKCIPKWHESIKPLREDVLFWGKIWKDMGRPTNNVTHEIYKSCRRKYHYMPFVLAKTMRSN